MAKKEKLVFVNRTPLIKAKSQIVDHQITKTGKFSPSYKILELVKANEVTHVYILLNVCQVNKKASGCKLKTVTIIFSVTVVFQLAVYKCRLDNNNNNNNKNG